MGGGGGTQKKQAFAPALAPDKLSEAFEHSITWEDDLWRADPVDVPEVHAKARRKFDDLVTTITAGPDLPELELLPAAADSVQVVAAR